MVPALALPALKSLALQGGNAGPSKAEALGGQSSGWMDGSGWVVNFGPSIGSGAAGSAAGGIPWLWFAAAAVAYLVWKKS